MSHFSYYFPSGLVPSGTIIPHGWFEHIEACTFASINGDGGGTYAPSSPIVVGGAGMTIALVGGNTLSDGYLQIASGADLSVSPGGQFHSYGTALFLGTNGFTQTSEFYSGSHTTFDAGSVLNVNGAATFTGEVHASYIGLDSIQIAENLYTAPDSVANLSGTLAVSQIANFYGVVTNHDITNLEGDAWANHIHVVNLDITGASTLTGVLVASGAGRVVRQGRLIHSGASAISPTVALNWSAQSLASDATVQIDDSGAVDGDELFISNRSSTYRVLINDPGGSLIASLKRASTFSCDARFQRISGSWYEIASSPPMP